MGSLTFFRVYSGVLRSGDAVHVSAARTRARRVGRLVQMHANERSRDRRGARRRHRRGRRVSKDVTTGDSLTDPEQRDHARDDGVSRARDRGGRRAEDGCGPRRDGRSRSPSSCARIRRCASARRRGVGPDDPARHGRAAPRDRRRAHEARVRASRRTSAGRRSPIARRSAQAVEQEGKFARQTAGRDQFGARVAAGSSRCPRARATSSSTRSPAAPCRAELVPAVEQGVREQMADGVIAGYPVVDVKVTVFDGSHRDRGVDRGRVQGRGRRGVQGRRAQGAARAARADHERRGRDAAVPPGRRQRRASRRRGVLQSIEDAPAGKIVRARVPLAEMFGYATALRSLSQGRATYTMEFSQYAEAPANVSSACHQGSRRLGGQHGTLVTGNSSQNRKRKSSCPKKNSSERSRT